MARTLPDLDQPRYAEWARVSLGVKALVVGLNIFIQGLGKIDAKLVYDDAAYQALSSEARSTLEVMLRLTDTYTLSQLWVLGALKRHAPLTNAPEKHQKFYPSDSANGFSAQKEHLRGRVCR